MTQTHIHVYTHYTGHWAITASVNRWSHWLSNLPKAKKKTKAKIKKKTNKNMSTGVSYWSSNLGGSRQSQSQSGSSFRPPAVAINPSSWPVLGWLDFSFVLYFFQYLYFCFCFYHCCRSQDHPFTPCTYNKPSNWPVFDSLCFFQIFFSVFLRRFMVYFYPCPPSCSCNQILRLTRKIFFLCYGIIVPTQTCNLP